ncbi:MAG: hypothetical protein IT518_19015 [Burkholderiales bacterium]|nr:hypothetical protein [Burkholderiales bacterium]
MTKRTGAWVFAVASMVSWGFTVYLAFASEAKAPYVRAMGFVALVLTLHTVLYILFSGRKSRKRDYFLRYGEPIETEITDIKRRGRRTAWRVKSQHFDKRLGKKSVFKSEILRRNPSRKFQVGDTVMVYLHPARPGQYWMETGIESEYL